MRRQTERGPFVRRCSAIVTVGFAGGDYVYFLPLGDVPMDKLAAAGPEAPVGADGSATARWHEMWGDRPISDDKVRRREMERTGLNPQGPPWGVPAAPANSYLLRSVSPEESDVLVAFRVDRRRHDGAVLIAWTLLRQLPVETREARRQREQAEREQERLARRRQVEEQRQRAMEQMREQQRRQRPTPFIQ
jgi:hypothetical protein